MMLSRTHEAATNEICARNGLQRNGLWTAILKHASGEVLDVLERESWKRPRPDAWRIFCEGSCTVVEVWEVVQSSRSAYAAIGKWANWWWCFDSTEEMHLTVRVFDTASYMECEHPLGLELPFVWDFFERQSEDNYSLNQFFDFCRRQAFEMLSSAQQDGTITEAGAAKLEKLSHQGLTLL